MNKQTTLASLNSDDNLCIIIMNYDSGATITHAKVIDNYSFDDKLWLITNHGTFFGNNQDIVSIYGNDGCAVIDSELADAIMYSFYNSLNIKLN